VADSLVHVGFLPDRETYVAQFRENVVKKHRLRRLERQRAAPEAGQ
jgi:hypothetical protein